MVLVWWAVGRAADVSYRLLGGGLDIVNKQRKQQVTIAGIAAVGQSTRRRFHGADGRSIMVMVQVPTTATRQSLD